ncbi:MAG: apolipoprotein N-acyltransferase [Ulvibacter sp.]|jgi:apolipoprotein N-acyltransferase
MIKLFEKLILRFGQWPIKIILVTLSGVLTSFSFAPWSIWPFGLICFIPIFLAFQIGIRTKVSTFLLALLYVLVVNSIAFHWMIHAIRVFSGLPLSTTLIVFIIFIIGNNSRFFIFFAFLHLWEEKGHLRSKRGKLYQILLNPYLIISCVWASCEMFGWQLFPWYGASLLSGNELFIQSVDIFGIQGLSILWMTIQLGIYELLKTLFQSIKLRLWFKRKPGMIMALTMLALIHIYGAMAISAWEEKQANFESKNIAVPQSNTPLTFQNVSEKEQPLLVNKLAAGIVNQSLSIINKAKKQGKKVSLVVWPESAIPFLSYSDPIYQKQIARLQNHYPVQIVINDEQNVMVGGEPRSYSNVWLIGRNGLPLDNYQKIFLLPFGEYIPLGNILPQLYNIFKEVSRFNPGTRFIAMEAQPAVFLPLVCYEVIQSNFVNKFNSKTYRKARMLVNITNDSWFGGSFESEQHLELARIRSIELRLPLVRATNGGISAQVDVLGRIQNPTKISVKAERLYNVKIPLSNSTIFSFVGLWPVRVCVILSLFLVSLLIMMSIKKKN